MKAKRVVPIFVTAACALAAVPAASAATEVQQAASANWSGYVVGSSSGSQGFKSVSGSWVEPTAKCNGSSTYSAFWVGLGGSGQNQEVSQNGTSTQALEQDGTEADCTANGTPRYFAWYELVPAAPVQLNLAIHPGDRISSRVSVSGQQVWIWLSDQTTGQSVSKTLQMANPDTSSAEWIAEAPSTCDQTESQCMPMALTDFGNVQFTNATATSTDGHTGTISDPDWSVAQVALSPDAGGVGIGDPQFASSSSSSNSTAGATPSSLSSDGSSFSVAWSDNASSTGGGSGDGYGSGYPGSGYGSGYPGSGYGSGYPSGYGGGGSGYGGGGGGGGGGYALVIPGVGVVTIGA